MVQEAHDPLPRLFIRSRLLHYPPVIKDLSLKSLQLVEPGHFASVWPTGLMYTIRDLIQNWPNVHNT